MLRQVWFDHLILCHLWSIFATFALYSILKVRNLGLGLRPNIDLAVRVIGVGMVALGTFIMLVATKLYNDELAHLKREASYTYKPRWSLGLVVGRLLALIGLVAFLSIVIGSIVS